MIKIKKEENQLICREGFKDLKKSKSNYQIYQGLSYREVLKENKKTRFCRGDKRYFIF